MYTVYCVYSIQCISFYVWLLWPQSAPLHFINILILVECVRIVGTEVANTRTSTFQISIVVNILFIANINYVIPDYYYYYYYFIFLFLFFFFYLFLFFLQSATTYIRFWLAQPLSSTYLYSVLLSSNFLCLCSLYLPNVFFPTCFRSSNYSFRHGFPSLNLLHNIISSHAFYMA